MISDKKIIGFPGQGASDSEIEVGDLLSKLRDASIPAL